MTDDITPNTFAQHGPDGQTTSGHANTKHTLRVATWLALGLVLLLLTAGAFRLLALSDAAAALEQNNKDNLTRAVNVTHAKPGKMKNTVSLPASLRGYSEGAIFARSNGYLSAWYKTIGDKVKKGELLAKVEAPEQTQELAQLKANREQVKARLALAKTTLERWETLRQHDSVPQQELEEKRGAYQQTVAELAVVDASVSRLEQLEEFRRIVAPFSGVITSRSVDVGDLIVPGSKELFALSQIDKLRLSVWVPQVYASEIKTGHEVTVSVRELRESFKGSIEHIAGSIDPTTRSRLVEVILPNPDNKLIPGSYAEVAIELERGIPAQIVPPSVLVIGKNDPYVVVVNKDNKIEFRAIKLGRDLGKTVEIIEGVTPEDTLVVSPSELLQEGEKVIAHPIESKDEEGGGKDRGGKKDKPNDASVEKDKAEKDKKNDAKPSDGKPRA